jgi:mannose-6-phosphate isomerase-like protein (cupin superfamily)
MPARRILDRSLNETRSEEKTMIVAGKTVENPVTGERLTFLETARETAGEYVRFEAQIAPGGSLPAAHLHPKQTERFEFVSGSLTMKVAGKTIHTKPGDVVVVEPGVPHDFENETNEPVRMIVEMRPALGLESLLETMYGLAADGKTNRWGMPNPFRLAVIADAHFDTVRVPIVPQWIQRAALAVGAPVGRLFGYAPVYQPSTAPRVLRPATA